jgi:hypothetical protein
VSSVQIKCPALNKADFIITIFHANTPPRERQQSSDVMSARPHNTVGESVVSPVLCTSSTNAWARSSSQCVLRKPQRKTKYDRTEATSSSHGNTSRGVLIARNSPSRGIIHRAASLSRGILIARYFHQQTTSFFTPISLAGLVSKPTPHAGPREILRDWPSQCKH